MVRAVHDCKIEGAVFDAALGCPMEYPREDAALRYDLLFHKPGMDGWARVDSADEKAQLYPQARTYEGPGVSWAIVLARVGVVDLTNFKETAGG